jgi:sec-independent protein translocase protein TatA
MPQLGTPELIIILVIVIIIFGVGRLPEIGAALGKAIRGFREASSRDDSAEPGESGDKETTDK